MMIHASEAGKHVYVEKPIGNLIGECIAMVAAQERYKNVVQVGQWQRSQQHFQDAVNYIATGVLGPAPIRPFNSSRFHFHFRWSWDYAGGLMTDWGVHLLDYTFLGMKSSLPKSIVGVGGKFAYPNLAEETPDTLTTLYEFDDFNLVWDSAMGIDNGSHGRDHGIAFIGNNATLILNRGGWEVIEERQSKNKVTKPLVKPSDNGLDNHTYNLIESIRSNDPSLVNCSIQEGAHVAKVAQMGNISYRSGEKLFWDSNKGKFTNESINRSYFTNAYHNGYNLPDFKK